MKTIIISVDHVDEKGKYWCDSYVKRAPVVVNEGESVHEAIARYVGDQDCCAFAYKGKPQGNIYRDTQSGTKVVGYHYRTKHSIANRSEGICKDNVPFTTWVTIHGEMTEPNLEELD